MKLWAVKLHYERQVLFYSIIRCAVSDAPAVQGQDLHLDDTFAPALVGLVLYPFRVGREGTPALGKTKFFLASVLSKQDPVYCKPVQCFPIAVPDTTPTSFHQNLASGRILGPAGETLPQGTPFRVRNHAWWSWSPSVLYNSSQLSSHGSKEYHQTAGQNASLPGLGRSESIVRAFKAPLACRIVRRHRHTSTRMSFQDKVGFKFGFHDVHLWGRN
ncbi:hypothetical protein VFPPC_15530 [Pochonia chlamydosporia 170]|uniref:Uncharacterized protein n=1 Tax=Pochonia chlamydosporia 170 TaxID=1380566 RepID=A0A179FWT6_METCM|nr:hypothetical protein VFPPC_15530 [Pochonia chlamydosporia 170]OAQ70082.1 hypothetical protein VFPPC_15530 [Pochonia chlamydosporia 170]